MYIYLFYICNIAYWFQKINTFYQKNENCSKKLHFLIIKIKKAE